MRCEAESDVCVPESFHYDKSDPGACRQCGDNMWRCNDGRCINQTLYRDGKFDCKDKSDEWQCAGSGKAISHDRVCDGRIDCNEGDDEDLYSGCNYANFYNRTGCPTWGWRRVFSSNRHGELECFREEEEEQFREWENSPEPPTSRHCQTGWRCRDGFCVDPRDLCDGIKHCHDGGDESHEEYLGCNLYPSENCTSFGGHRYVRCETDDRVCVQDYLSISFNISDPLTCRDCGVSSKWRCNSGACIDLAKVCDGTKDCEDGSDESSEALEGCNLYPSNTEPCSWSVGGERHVRCEADPAVCVPEILANSSDYRHCGDNKWRCNDGLCINHSQFRDGKFDCQDETDEIHSSKLTPLHAVTIIAFIVLIGLVSLQIIIPFYHRLVHCPEFDEKFEFQDDWIPRKLIELLDKIVEEEESPIKGPASSQEMIELAPMVEMVEIVPNKKEAKVKYQEMRNSKQGKVKYHHLYMYIENRYTDKKLFIARDFLYKIEEELDGEDYFLFGVSQGTAVLNNMIKYFTSPTIKNLGCLTIQLKKSYIFYPLSIVFCFERTKNLVLFIIFWMALCELPFGWEYLYSICFLLLLLTFIVVQWRHYRTTTRTYKEPLFEQEDSEIKRKINNTLKIGDTNKLVNDDSEDQDQEENKVPMIVLCVLLSTVMPLVVTIKHAWYSSILRDQKRKLRDAQESQDRIQIYKRICNLESKILMYRKCLFEFSTSSVLESLVVVFCLILVSANSQVRGGVEYRLNSILGLHEALASDNILMIFLYFFVSLALSATTFYFVKIKKEKHIQKKRLTKEIKRRKLLMVELTKSQTTIGPTCWVELKSGRGWAEIKLEPGNPGGYLDIARELSRQNFIR